MKSETVTKLSIPHWARLLGINPLHVMGVQVEEIQQGTCDVSWFQYGWQNASAVSREELAVKIRQAEDEIEHYLRARLLPSWEEDEVAIATPPARPDTVWHSPFNARGYWQSVETQWKHLISGGRRAQTLIDDAAAVVYTDSIPSTAYFTPPSVLYKDTATVTVTVAAGTAANEIAVYCPGREGDERYRIRPVSVSITGTTATITFRRELAIDPDMQEGIGTGANFMRPVDGRSADPFLTTVDVYRVYNDGATQAALLWLPPNGGAPGALAEQAAALTVSDARMGFVQYRPGTWDGDTSAFVATCRSLGRQPDAVRLYYRSGLPAAPNGEMSHEWALTVAILAAARLDRPVCNCASGFVNRWQRDYAVSEPKTNRRLDERLLGNPIGTLAGEIYAWERVLRASARVAVSA